MRPWKFLRVLLLVEDRPLRDRPELPTRSDADLVYGLVHCVGMSPPVEYINITTTTGGGV